MSQNELLKAYGKHTEELPSAVQQTVASVLFNCLQAVTTATRPSSAKGAVDGLSPGHEVICGTTLVSLPTSGTNATFSSLVAATRKAARAASEIGNDSILLPANDSSSLYTAIGTITMMSQDDGKNHPSSTEYAHILMDLHDFEYRAMVRRAVPLILRNPKDTHGNTNSSSSVGFPLLVETSLTRSVNLNLILRPPPKFQPKLSPFCSMLMSCMPSRKHKSLTKNRQISNPDALKIKMRTIIQIQKNQVT